MSILTLIPSLHYLVKFKIHSLTVYNNEFILVGPWVDSEMTESREARLAIIVSQVFKMSSSSTNASGRR